MEITKNRKLSLAKNENEEKVIKIAFSYDLDLIMKIRTIPGRKYHPMEKVWSAPIHIDTLRTLISWDFIIDENLHNFMEKVKYKSDKIIRFGIPDLKGKLYPFQIKGVSFIEEHNGRALVADQMGLGKTIEALGYIQLHRNKSPVLIVCPASLKFNWQNEIEKWLPDPSVEILSGTKIWEPKAEIVIINYDILSAWLAELKKIDVKILVFDECFMAGTKILTPSGEKNIEELKKGDFVYHATGIGKIENVQRRLTEKILKVTLSNKKTIFVTPNHPFFTEIGWTIAKNLKIGQKLFSNSNIFNILRQDTKLKYLNYEKLRMVWQRNITRKKQILQQILFSEMETFSTFLERDDETKNYTGKMERNSTKEINKSSGDKGENFKKNEEKQSNAQKRNKRKSKSIFQRIWTSYFNSKIERRKWKTITNCTKNIMGGIRSRLEIGIFNKDKHKKTINLPFLLQSRFGIAKQKNLDRDRWMESFIRRPKKIGYQKRKLFEDIRVERIEIYQPTSNGEPYSNIVYNLQVSGHPSYYAEGVLVHNCHKLKNSSTIRTKAAKKLAKNVPHIIALSGTPILNRPIEIYNTLYIIDNTLFPSYRYFAQQYCNYHFNGFGWNANGSSNTEELHQKLISTVMIRRLKKDVLPELPDKIFSFVPIELNNIDEYEDAEKDFISFVREQKGLEAAKRASNAIQFSKIEGLKQLAIKGKLDECITWIEDFLDTEDKLVVFAWHTKTIDILYEKFGKIAVKFDGKMNAIQIEQAKISFQTDLKIRLFIGQIATAGEGITLTAASNLAFVELPWTPGGLDQCIDRLHRIGQKDSVNVYYLLAKGTIEEKIAHLIDTKRQTFDSVLDGKITDSQSLITEIMKLYE